jgi:hypothetical protein
VQLTARISPCACSCSRATLGGECSVVQPGQRLAQAVLPGFCSPLGRGAEGLTSRSTHLLAAFPVPLEKEMSHRASPFP